MFKRFFKWLDDRAEARRLHRYYDGYHWASKVLRDGRMTPEEVEALINPVQGRDEFDRGAMRAVFNYGHEVKDIHEPN